ncbi:SDR family oxidoreductase [Chitinophagaceae bacterium LB-8]|uniref:SDR family oxidoreductase n=1 Tax=Paraflavisolibacter caeni TaxID=2982496 RepID=A0A9X2XSY7_9BACT|nr:SDR family NAD(P)-dependent oxidoreductase [Paraflavisolibacter caeni]MCU7547812.1 SDR family oxidoreductase [Paraflavisolibacter caeni]
MNVVITGASRGLGKAIARKFAANGYDLFLSSRHEESLLPAAEELKAEFPSVAVHAKAFDLGKKQQAQFLARWVLEQASSVDILVNNAGTFVPGNVSDEPDGALEEMLDVNLCSAYHLTRALLPRFMEQRSGHIFNMGSIAGLKAYPGGGSYSISKFALHGFSKNLRHELMPHGIKVTTLIPGAVFTDSWKGFVAEERIMQADDIAQLVYTASQLSLQATVEEIIIRPQLGDL